MSSGLTLIPHAPVESDSLYNVFTVYSIAIDEVSFTGTNRQCFFIQIQ